MTIRFGSETFDPPNRIVIPTGAERSGGTCCCTVLPGTGVIGLKIFLTGATGFVGSHVAQELSRRGADLRVLIRPSSKLENLAGLPAETVLGDLLNIEALRTALKGCDAVMHVAADYRLWVTDPEAMNAANVTATRDLLRL